MVNLQNKTPLATVITFGCQQNEADSEIMRGFAAELGYTICDEPELCDLIVVNTCAIREHAESKALSLLGRFKKLKAANPNLIIGLVGCMAAEPHVVKQIKGNFKYVDFTLEPSRLDLFSEVVERCRTTGERCFVYGAKNRELTEGAPMIRSDKHKAWVSIMYGCNNFCSYCIVPYTRGRERSRRSLDVIEECKKLVCDGVSEITLLGQNVNSYKSDMDFADLLEAVAQIPGDFVIKFMTSHPKDVSDKLIEVMAKYKGKIAPYFHLPLQSGSSKILKKMNRTYDRERYLAVVDKLREKIPDITLSTDIIIGFPGESDEDFELTLDILQKVKYDMVYSFLYSKRKGTPAAVMEDQVPLNLKKERMKRLLALQDEISYCKNRSLIGQTVTVLIDSVDGEGIATARMSNNKIVHFNTDETKVGKTVSVRVTKACPYDLIGEEII